MALAAFATEIAGQSFSTILARVEFGRYGVGHGLDSRLRAAKKMSSTVSALGRGARINWRNIEKIQEGGENRW